MTPPLNPENPKPNAGEVTVLLRLAFHGDSDARDLVVQLLEPEIRKIASSYLRGERQGHSLQTTELIDELWVKLLRIRSAEIEDRKHFFCLCARILRNFLISEARKRREEIGIDGILIPDARTGVRIGLLEIDELLTLLEKIDPQKARIVELEIFLEMRHPEVSQYLGLSESMVRREWEEAKAWLYYRVWRNQKPAR